MEDAESACGYGGGRFGGIYTAPGGFAADETDALVTNKIVECTDRIGAAPDTGHNGVGQFSLQFHDLFPDFL